MWLAALAKSQCQPFGQWVIISANRLISSINDFPCAIFFPDGDSIICGGELEIPHTIIPNTEQGQVVLTGELEYLAKLFKQQREFSPCIYSCYLG